MSAELNTTSSAISQTKILTLGEIPLGTRFLFVRLNNAQELKLLYSDCPIFKKCQFMQDDVLKETGYQNVPNEDKIGFLGTFSVVIEEKQNKIYFFENDTLIVLV